MAGAAVSMDPAQLQQSYGSMAVTEEGVLIDWDPGGEVLRAEVRHFEASLEPAGTHSQSPYIAH